MQDISFYLKLKVHHVLIPFRFSPTLLIHTSLILLKFIVPIYFIDIYYDMSVCMIYIIIIIWVCIIYVHILYKLFLKYKIHPTQTCLHVFGEDYLILNNQLVWFFHFQHSVVFCRYSPMVDWGPMRFHSFSLLAFLLLSYLFRYFFYAAMVMRLDEHRFSDISMRHYIASKFLFLWLNPVFFWDCRT